MIVVERRKAYSIEVYMNTLRVYKYGTVQNDVYSTVE